MLIRLPKHIFKRLVIFLFQIIKCDSIDDDINNNVTTVNDFEAINLPIHEENDTIIPNPSPAVPELDNNQEGEVIQWDIDSTLNGALNRMNDVNREGSPTPSEQDIHEQNEHEHVVDGGGVQLNLPCNSTTLVNDNVNDDGQNGEVITNDLNPDGDGNGAVASICDLDLPLQQRDDGQNNSQAMAADPNPDGEVISNFNPPSQQRSDGQNSAQVMATHPNPDSDVICDSNPPSQQRSDGQNNAQVMATHQNPDGEVISNFDPLIQPRGDGQNNAQVMAIDPNPDGDVIYDSNPPLQQRSDGQVMAIDPNPDGEVICDSNPPLQQRSDGQVMAIDPNPDGEVICDSNPPLQRRSDGQVMAIDPNPDGDVICDSNPPLQQRSDGQVMAIDPNPDGDVIYDSNPPLQQRGDGQNSGVLATDPNHVSGAAQESGSRAFVHNPARPQQESYDGYMSTTQVGASVYDRTQGQHDFRGLENEFGGIIVAELDNINGSIFLVMTVESTSASQEL